MTARTVEVTNPVGLHARPASFFVNKACAYRSTILLEKGECRVNAKSVLSVLSMGIRQGDTVTLIANGQDEEAAVEGLVLLLGSQDL
ncbi:MAG: HPr family phosphocarrier protein [Clostridia bacterium]|nr:HPr family phosphocarrier protein [Clostridia bacterium]